MFKLVFVSYITGSLKSFREVKAKVVEDLGYDILNWKNVC